MDADTTRAHAAPPGDNAPLVVIVTPTYNRASLVSAAIDSALAQDYANLNLVVVDDGSTDNTADVLARYQNHPRVRIIHRERNGGVAAAKNTGIDALPASCRYFGILDSDDVLLPGVIVPMVNALERSGSQFSQVFGWCEDAQTGEPTGHMTHRAGLVTYEDALCGRFEGEFWQLVRKDHLGAWRFDERGAGDEAMVWWPMMKAAPALLLDLVVRIYDRSGTDRVNRPSFTERGARSKMWGIATLLERVGTDMRAACPDRFAAMALEHAKWAALGGMRGRAWRSIREAFRAAPSVRAVKVAALSLGQPRFMRAAYRRLYQNRR